MSVNEAKNRPAEKFKVRSNLSGNIHLVRSWGILIFVFARKEMFTHTRSRARIVLALEIHFDISPVPLYFPTPSTEGVMNDDSVAPFCDESCIKCKWVNLPHTFR